MTKKELLIYIGNKIKEIRELHGFSQTELGDKRGVELDVVSTFSTLLKRPKIGLSRI